jgi:hypothetical protein
MTNSIHAQIKLALDQLNPRSTRTDVVQKVEEVRKHILTQFESDDSFLTQLKTRIETFNQTFQPDAYYREHEAEVSLVTLDTAREGDTNKTLEIRVQKLLEQSRNDHMLRELDLLTREINR